ncbi:MAG: nicotinate-nucleotide adenylyltransferase [Cocleimonas sp.]
MIAILGGTFDPIHFGHLRPAVEIVEKLSLSELRFIPSAKPPHRWQPEASAAHRLKMVKKAIKAYPKFVVDEREYDRLKKDNTASFTIDTVCSIREEIGETESLGMIVGTDAFQSFTQWRDWEDILSTVHLIVASRPGYDEKGKSEEWVQQRLETDTNELHKSASGKVFFCDVTQLDISATFIRNQIDEAKSCCYLTPKKVIKYIKKHTLYESWS